MKWAGLILVFIPFLMSAQELTLNEVLYADMLELRCEHKAERIAEKLWQIGVEVEIQKGFLDKKKRYYIEIQDLEVLNIEIEKKKRWKRYFSKRLKKKLIKVEFGGQ